MVMIRKMMCSSSSQLLAALFLIVVFCKSCKASSNVPQNCSSLCGGQNVRRPFRLKDFPEVCGDHRYNLSCQHNQLVLYLKSRKYSVLSINYENYTIRVKDANVVEFDYSSLPRDSLTDYNFRTWDPCTTTYLTSVDEFPLSKIMIYVRCKRPMDSPSFVNTTPCFKTSDYDGFVTSSSWYSYVNVGSETLGDLGLEDECRIELMYMTSWPADLNNHSCKNIHNLLLYGFELSWMNSFCQHEYEWAVLEVNGNKKQPRCDYYSYPEFLLAFLLALPRIVSGFRWVPDEFVWRLQQYPWAIIPFLRFAVFLTFAIDILVYLAALKFVLGTPFVVVLLIKTWRRRHLSMYNNIEDFLQSDNNIMPLRYSYKNIKKMTKGFKLKLGKGGYGSVFKGQLQSGREVAVKMLDKATADGQEFINEVATLGRIHHVNVVQIIGYCVEGSKRALIYEFMQNGSLDKYIFSKHDTEQSLNLFQLYDISVGVARGIEYLHKGCNMQILHFDIKPHNILLDDNFIPKVSDFGLAKLYPTNDSIVSLTAARGTIGYMAPELFYRNVGGISYKADVYSFGMLLMEIAGRRKNLNVLTEHSSQFYFPFWVYDQLNEGKEINILDVTVEEMKLARKMMIVGLWCIQTKPNDRPSMNEVVHMLEGEEQDLEFPQKPYLHPQDLPTIDVSDHSSSTMSSKPCGHPSMTKVVEMVEEEE